MLFAGDVFAFHLVPKIDGPIFNRDRGDFEGGFDLFDGLAFGHHFVEQWRMLRWHHIVASLFVAILQKAGVIQYVLMIWTDA